MSLAGSHAARLTSFSLEDFGDLVSSALDLHAHLGSNLDLAFGSQLSLSYLPSQTRQSSEIDHGFNASRSYNSANAFTQSGKHANDEHAFNIRLGASLDDTRRLASSSVPALALNARPPPKRPVQPSVRKSVSLSRLDASFVQQLRPVPHATSNLRQVESVSHDSMQPSSPSTFKFPSLIPQWAKQRKDPDSRDNTRVKSSSMSFFSLRFKSFPKLTRKVTKTTNADSDGLRSFFDDDIELDGIRGSADSSSGPRRLDRPGHQTKTPLYSISQAAQQQNIAHISKDHTKALPPVAQANGRAFNMFHSAQDYHNTIQGVQATATKANKLAHISHNPRDSSSSPLSLFYQPPSPHLPAEAEAKHGSKPRTRLGSRPPPSLCVYGYPYTPKFIPPPFPSPTSPLPPTPSLATVPLPCLTDNHSGTKENKAHISSHSWISRTKDDDTASINSDEILSWRGTGSRSAVHHIDEGGNNMCDDVDLESFAPSMLSRSSPSRSSSKRGSWSSTRLTPRPRPLSGLVASNGNNSASAKSMLLHPMKLASASFVSLRSASNLAGAIFKNGSESPVSLELGSDRDDALACRRVLTPEDDPFAGPLPPSPASSCWPTPETPLHPYAAADYFSSAATHLTPKAEKVPRTPVYENSNVLQTPIRIKSTPKKATPKVSPILTSPTTPTSSRLPRKEKGISASVSPSKRNSIIFPLPPTPASITASSDFSDNFDDLTIKPKSKNSISFPEPVKFDIPHQPCRPAAQRSFSDACVAPRRSKVAPKLTGNGTFDLDHSDSRPHSPFPLRSLSNASTDTTLGAPADFMDAPRLMELSNTSDVRPDSNVISEHDVAMVALQVPVIDDADVSVDACSSEDAARQMVSPTAWFLDSDSDSCANCEDTKNAGNLDASQKLLSSNGHDAEMEPLLQPGNRLSFWDSCSLFERDISLAKSPSEPDSRTESSETSEDKLIEIEEAWPLPPHRTIVVDETSEEGWHDVEPMVEYAPSEGVVPDAWRARHSVRFPSSTISSDFCVYNNGVIAPSGAAFNSTRTTRTLSVEQTRVIAQQLSGLQTMQIGMTVPQTPGSHCDRDDHRSTKSSYFSARSTERASVKSMRSKSSKSSVQSIHVVQDEGTLKAAAATYISPPTSPVTPGGRARSRSVAAALTSDRTRTQDLPQVSVNGNRVSILDLIPGNMFSIHSADDSISVAAVNMNQFVTFCNGRKSFSIVSSVEGMWKLAIVRDTSSINDNEVPSMPGGLPPKASTNVKVTLCLARDNFAPQSGEIIAHIDLPTSFGDIGDHLANLSTSLTTRPCSS